jgi:quinohemoprotein ethanol dehydrogenase
MTFRLHVWALGLVSLAFLSCAPAALAKVGAAGAPQTSIARTAAVAAPAFSPSDLSAYASDNWLTSGGGLTDNRYSTLTQINKSNVASLKIAWQAHFGLTTKQLATSFGQEASPVVYAGTLYVPDALGDVFAFDGATGAQLWKHTNTITGPQPLLATERGIAVGDGRIYLGSIDDKVVALDQATGGVVWETHIGRVQDGESMTAAPLYYEGMVIVGMSGGDLGARGFAAAFDAKTGLEKWRWYVTPSPGEVGFGSWTGNEWEHSGSIWVYPSVDTQLGLLYLVTGNPVPWNGRGPGDNLWTDSIVALHVQNGQFAWGFQTVHHDIWDYDVTNPPVLFDAMYNGVLRHGIAVASKPGWVYILDRSSGAPLIGIDEKKVPQYPKGSAAAKYANLSPTQPVPVGDALLNQCPKKSWWPGKAPDGKPYKVGCIFTPYAPTKHGSFAAVSPFAASIDWPPSAFNPQTNYLYVCAHETSGFAIGAIPKGQQLLVQGSLYVGVNFGFPKKKLANTGRVIAVDILTNRIAWKDVWPQPCYSGMMTTAGGLLFAGQVAPRVVTAFDASSGQTLWTSPELDAAPMAPSITYTVNGKQYLAIVAGGGGSGAGLSGKRGDLVVAFSLP